MLYLIRLSVLPILAMGLIGCGPGVPAVMDRSDFEARFRGVKLDDVRAVLGAPNNIDTFHKTWEYRARTRKNANAKPDHAVYLIPDNDRVGSISYREEAVK